MHYETAGEITRYIDIPQLAFWVFVLFFVSLVFWLQRESKREGYPLKASPFTREKMEGFPPPPAKPLTYILNEGGTTQAPHYYEPGDVHAEPVHKFDGTAFSPIGNPLLAGIGPGSWVKKKDEPALTERGARLLQKLSTQHEYAISNEDADPRGMVVFDWRWNEAGCVTDVWIDTGIKIARILEVQLPTGKRVLVPIYYAQINERRREVRVIALWTYQFVDVPMPAHPDFITGPEEERLNAYFAAGRFYRDDPLVALPSRQIP